MIAAIKTTKTAAAFDTTGLGAETLPAAVRHRAGQDRSLKAAGCSGRDEDGKTLTLGIVNPTPSSPLRCRLPSMGAKLAGKGRFSAHRR